MLGLLGFRSALFGILGVGAVIGLSYLGAYGVKTYRKIKQHNLRHTIIKENKAHVKHDCAYRIDIRCDD